MLMRLGGTQTRPLGASSLLLAGIVLAGNWQIGCSQTEICNGEDFQASCSPDHVIMMTSAEFGRKDVGRCITEADDFMGCTNDVLPILDNWCSSREECEVEVTNPNFAKYNTACLKILTSHLEVAYSCVPVQMHCTASSKNVLSANHGIISSHVSAEKGCGGQRSPWVVSVSPGQTVNMSLVDFSVDPDGGQNLVQCRRVYGYILERALGINHTICGGATRDAKLYESKTNTVEIVLLNQANAFLIKYHVLGCANLKPPAHAWYKREGDEAVIGCETNDQEWRLTCSGNTWHGTVGNCSEPVVVPVVERTKSKPKSSDLSVHSLVILTAIIGGAVVVIVAAIMCGVIHMKKYKLRQDRKRIQLHVDYATLGRKPGAVCKPQIPNNNLICMDPPQHQNVLRDWSEREPIWKMPLPDPHGNSTSHPGDNTQGTLTSRGQSESANLMENFVAKYCPLEN